MGERKKPQNEEEVLGQIFDFVFKEARKPADKRKPIKLKPTGISTSHELVDGLAVALEKPGMLVTDQMLDSLNSALTIELGSLKANESGSRAATITTSNLAEFLSNPNKFLSTPKQKAKKTMRDYMKAGFLGRVQQGLVANAWAHKYNLDLDAKKAILGHYQAENIGREAEAGRAFASAAGTNLDGKREDSRKNYIASRSASLVGREMFGRDGWENMSEEKRDGLQKAIIRGDEAVEKYLNDTYTGSSAKLVPKLLSRYDGVRSSLGVKADDPAVNVFDNGIYNKLETRNLKGRQQDLELYLKMHPNLSVNEKAKIQEGIMRLGQAEVIVSGTLGGMEGIARARRDFNQRISDCKQELLLAKRSGDKDKVKYYNGLIKDLKQGDRELNGMKFWGTVGTWEGRLDTVKAMGGITGTNVALNILNGEFFDSRKNKWNCPTSLTPVSFKTHTWELKDEDGNVYKKPYTEEIEILTANHTDLTNLTGSKRALAASMNKYNELMTGIYYLTPNSILKTLFVNGEGFIHSTYKQVTQIKRKLGKDIDMGKLMRGDKAYLASLSTLGLTPMQIARLRTSSFFARTFSLGQRARDTTKAWLDEHLYKKIRQRIYKNLVTKLVNTEAKALLEQWLIKGGMEVIGKALAITFLNGLGIAVTGGLGAFLMPIISGIIVDVLYASAKVIIQVLMLVAFGIIGFIWYGMSSGKQSFDSQAYAYTNVVPGEVVTNPNFRGSSPIVGEDDDEMDDFIGGTLPDGQKCLLGSGAVHCSQGAFGNYSHQAVAAVDLSSGGSDFFAPQFCGNDNCTVTFNGTTTCTAGSAGGMIIFTASYGGTSYEFKLIHVKAVSGVGVGTKLSAGQQVARVQTIEETTTACSSGRHIHLQTKVNGRAVDPWQVMTKSPSQGGFGCNISVCDP